MVEKRACCASDFAFAFEYVDDSSKSFACHVVGVISAHVGWVISHLLFLFGLKWDIGGIVVDHLLV